MGFSLNYIESSPLLLQSTLKPVFGPEYSEITLQIVR